MNAKNLVEKSTIEFDLQRLIEPIGIQDFIDHYWEKDPLILNRKNADYFHDLFSIDDVDQVLDLHRPTGPSIRVVKNQEPLLPTSKYENPDGTLNLNQLYASYSDGYTLNINEIQRYWQPLKALCQRMSRFLSHHTVANMYLTPKHQKALLPHYDTHDVFVIQVYGCKHWKTYDTTVETPLLHSYQPIFQREQLSNARELTLEAGDMMYMPRGVPHEAYTTDNPSLHITVGVHPAQWMDLLNHSLKQLALSKIELRKALPIGYLNPTSWTPEFVAELQNNFNALLEMVSKEANFQHGAQLLAEEFRAKDIPRGDGHFRQIDQIESLELENYVEKRQEVSCSVQSMGSLSRIIFPGNIIKGPGHIGQPLQFIATAEGPFQVREIPALSDENKIKLVARLIRGGLLKIK